MGEIREQKCINCGAAMRYDPATGMLVCDYCGTKTQIRPDEPVSSGADTTIEGFDFRRFIQGAEKPDAEKLPVYICKSCGAELIAPAEEFSLNCPYCGNAIILTDKISGSLRPDGVIPFSVTPDELPGAMRRFYRNKILKPINFFAKSKMDKVTGVYVPFWVFGGTASGTLIYRGERKKSSGRAGDFIYYETDVYNVERGVSVDFKDVPVDASGKIDDALMDSLEPFDMDGVKPFDVGYLAGFTADRFDVAADDIAKRAERRMCNTALSAATRMISGYDSLKQIGGRMKADLEARYILMPVYLFTMTHEDKKYSYAVNGQTGRVVGEVPNDKKVGILFLIICAALIFGGLMLARYILYLLIK